MPLPRLFERGEYRFLVQLWFTDSGVFMAGKKGGAKTTLTHAGKTFDMDNEKEMQDFQEQVANDLRVDPPADPAPSLPAGERRFTKITLKEQDVKLCMEEVIDENNSKEITFKSTEQAHQDFALAMRGLENSVRHILQWSEEYAQFAMTISGVSFSTSEKTGVRGAVISGYVKLDTATSPFFFNTPYLPYEDHNDNEEAALLPEYTIRALDKLELEADAYLKGKRAQLQMDFGEAA